MQTLYRPLLHQHTTIYCRSVLSRLQFRNHSRYCNCCLQVFSFAGITTVLPMTFTGLEARTDLPKVPYPTALDFFVFLSFAFIFATIIQVSKLFMEPSVRNLNATNGSLQRGFPVQDPSEIFYSSESFVFSVRFYERKYILKN